MKRIKIIEQLASQAMERGHAVLRRGGREVYRIEVEQDILTMYHYGTPTIRYDMRARVLLHWYGESVSDRDSMNTLLNYLGEHRYIFRYGPVMGFQLQERGATGYESRIISQS